MARPSGAADPDPAYIQRNVESLSKIGGVYDFLAFAVERDHADILRQYRLDTGAKSLAELLRDRGDSPQPNTPTNEG